MILEFLRWLDTDPLRYRAAAWGALVVVAVLAFAPRWRWKPMRSPVVFGAALLLALAAFRWPTMLFNRSMENPDGSQLIAAAMTMAVDPVPFRSVDTQTSGPLTPLAILAVARCSGLEIDFVAARLLGLLCAWLLVLAQWRTLRAAADDTTARLLALPLAAALGSAFHHDIAELISEPVPAALLAGGLWALAPALAGAPVSRGRLALAGILLGSSPLAKLQAAPIGVCTGLAGMWMVWIQAADRKVALRRVATLVASSLSPAVLLVVTTAAAGTFGEFHASYISANIGYAGTPLHRGIDGFAAVVGMIPAPSPFQVLFWSAVVSVVPAATLARHFPPATRRLSWFAPFLFAAGFLAVAAPGRAFPHYLFFLFGPSALLCSVLVAGCLQVSSSGRFRWLRPGVGPWLWAAWACGTMLPILWLRLGASPEPLGQLGKPDPEALSLQATIRPFAAPGDTMTVWGWMPKYHPQSGLRQATREAQTQHQIENLGWNRDRERARFLSDLRRRPPAIFIDSTGPGDWYYKSFEACRHETFPALAQWLLRHYVEVGVHNHGRVYARHDRVSETDPSAGALAPLFPGVPSPARWRGRRPMLLDDKAVLAHAPSVGLWAPFVHPQIAQFRFGLLAGAHAGGNRTDGVVFRVFARGPGHGAETVLFERHLRPLTDAADRGDQTATVLLPAGRTIGFETDPGADGNDSWDWAYWRDLRIGPPGP